MRVRGGVRVERVHHRCERVALLGRLDDEPGQLLPVHALLTRGAHELEQRVDLLKAGLDELGAMPILRLLVAQLLHARLLRLPDLVHLVRVRVRVRGRVLALRLGLGVG